MKTHELDDLRHGFGFLMYDTTRLMNSYYDRRVRSFGITRTQWTLLTYLSRYEGASQTKLAEYMDLAPMTLTRQIDKLEHDGLLDRRQDPTDRRTNLIYLTEKSQPLMKHMHEVAVEAREAALKNFTPEEREQLRSYLLKMRDNMATA
ncbi:MarR family winged helix-turn-helix transcriptional regulator [Dichelobacter nodosus]|uniref:MarR family transcriptional regulator n=1 Tax=Dichelobacter nodosus (strain VCS1703A) TaxID=246195 RepID=A5EWL3_DICNV|nr:MarR family transcriptional regulator [Dichelobacter nodosus]ABQ13381.1 MarR family transcriptional regulator [Dichelobacter nodosus VCS1703A]AXM45079.1 MarR family transcriptional regulator [Dichelobacter nodosus]KNZ39764.1 MarR family transcriptional regulator [Dichelobacter nodosus]TGA65926.1 MarR family transcriptional regulator [Dichelobacter nodosus]